MKGERYSLFEEFSRGSERARANPQTADLPGLQDARPRVWKVASLVSALTRHVENAFADVRVEGEVSNCRMAPSGHLYFTLKDGDAQLPVVMFRTRAQMVGFRLEDGMSVLARGRVSVYEARGQMQLVAESLEPLGDGALRLAFEQLKQKLSAEGLFDEARKKPLPAFPRAVGIITSPAGAVIRDILNILKRRSPCLDILIYPAGVQGATAAQEFRAGIVWFQSHQHVDVVILARGGGSLEDLAPFNDESLARAVAACELPVVSAIGHETDFSITDFVADLRAPTPSAAAELVSEAYHRLEERIMGIDRRLERAARYRLSLARERLSRLTGSPALASMRDFAARRQQRLDELSLRLVNAERQTTRAIRIRFDGLSTRLHRQNMQHRLLLMRRQTERLSERLAAAAQLALQRGQRRLDPVFGKLATLSPLAILERGYALVYDAHGQLLKDAAMAHSGDLLHARLARGSVTSMVTRAVPRDAEIESNTAPKETRKKMQPGLFS